MVGTSNLYRFHQVPEIWPLIHYQWTGGIEPSRTSLGSLGFHPLRRTAPFPACPVSGGVVASARELPTPPTRRGPRGPRADGLKSLHARCDRKSGTSRYYLMIYHEILHNKQLLVQQFLKSSSAHQALIQSQQCFLSEPRKIRKTGISDRSHLQLPIVAAGHDCDFKPPPLPREIQPKTWTANLYEVCASPRLP